MLKDMLLSSLLIELPSNSTQSFTQSAHSSNHVALSFTHVPHSSTLLRIHQNRSTYNAPIQESTHSLICILSMHSFINLPIHQSTETLLLTFLAPGNELEDTADKDGDVGEPLQQQQQMSWWSSKK